MSKNTEAYKHLFRALMFIIMTAAVTFLFALIWTANLNILLDRPFLIRGRMFMVGFYMILMIFFIAAFGGYDIGVSRISHAAIGTSLGSFLTNLMVFIVTVLMIGRMNLVPAIIIQYLQLIILDILILFILVYFGTAVYRRIFPPFMMLQIHGRYSNNLDRKMNQRRDKYKIAKTLSEDTPFDVITKEIDNYDAVLINDVPSELKNRILKVCFDKQKRVYFTPKISDIIVKESSELNIFDSPLYLSRNIGFSISQRIIKRTGDIIISLLGIIITSPVMLVTAIAIHSYDKGPVFYKQTRYTIHKKKFQVIKFRSMITDAEAKGGARLATENDDRITPVGHFIRATRIDEIPQFFNVLKGDMSFVGPRPERPEIHEEYCRKVPEFDFRLSVKAGLTGYAQVYGKYNTTTYDKLKFDMMYVQKASIFLDLQLILLTLRVVFQKESTEGIEEGETTAK